MRVVITGANSAVGQAILRCGQAQEAAPIAFVAAVRSTRAAREIEGLVQGSNVALISYDDPATLDAAFQGASAVIHLAGILVERPGSSYEQANVAPARSIVEAAKWSAVKKLVLVSATRADQASSNRYWRTKGQAEDLVRAAGLPYTVLRAPLLLGPGTEGAAALRRNAGQRRAMLIGGGRNLQQPLHVDDLARAAVAAARLSVADNCTLDLVGPVSLPDREIVERASLLMGRQIRIWSIPKKWAAFTLTIRQRTGRHGLSLDALDVITADTALDPRPAAAQLGIRLTEIDEMIRSSMESIQ